MLPNCWGHRGASVQFPENTLASFEAAIRDGAEGIESDVHVSSDGVVVMFHDPSLDRTTDGTGKIKELPWFGPPGVGMEHVRTKKEPKQGIPTFEDTLNLLMKPENQHALFNIDVKPQNDPSFLFGLLHKHISSHPDYLTVLAPRLILGLWHPSFIAPAKQHLPYLKRSYLGSNIEIAKKYFWKDCDYLSIRFSSMAGAGAGGAFVRECRKEGKKLIVWTVNKPEAMIEAVRWGVDVIITDTPSTYLTLRTELYAALRSPVSTPSSESPPSLSSASSDSGSSSDSEELNHAAFESALSSHSRSFLWTTLGYYYPLTWLLGKVEAKYLESVAGPFLPSVTE